MISNKFPNTHVSEWTVGCNIFIPVKYGLVYDFPIVDTSVAKCVKYMFFKFRLSGNVVHRVVLKYIQNISTKKHELD